MHGPLTMPYLSSWYTQHTFTLNAFCYNHIFSDELVPYLSLNLIRFIKCHNLYSLIEAWIFQSFTCWTHGNQGQNNVAQHKLRRHVEHIWKYKCRAVEGVAQAKQVLALVKRVVKRCSCHLEAETSRMGPELVGVKTAFISAIFDVYLDLLDR